MTEINRIWAAVEEAHESLNFLITKSLLCLETVLGAIITHTHTHPTAVCLTGKCSGKWITLYVRSFEALSMYCSVKQKKKNNKGETHKCGWCEMATIAGHFYNYNWEVYILCITPPYLIFFIYLFPFSLVTSILWHIVLYVSSTRIWMFINIFSI